MAENVPQLFFPRLVSVKNALYQIEHPENIRICLDHNHAAPIIERRQVPVLPKADKAYILAQ